MNNEVFFFFYNLAHKSIFFDYLIIFLGYILPILILYGVSIFLLKESNIFNKNDSVSVRLRRLIYNFTIIFGPAIFVFLVATFLKEIIHLERSFIQFNEIKPLFNPNQEYSFPSSHATIFSALGLSMYFYNKKIGVFLIFLALLIGFARITAGVHFPVDILSGFLLGFVVSYILGYIFNYFSKKS